MATKVRVRVEAGSVGTKKNLLSICDANGIKITKVVERSEDFIFFFFASLADTDKFCPSQLQEALSVCKFSPVFPASYLLRGLCCYLI